MRKIFTLIFAIVLFSSVQVFAQTADELINKNIQAHGGLDKLKAVKSIKMTGKINMGQGMEAPFIYEKKRPDKIRIEFTIQGLNNIQAYDGTTAWAQAPIAGSKEPQKMNEEDTQDMIEQADFDGPLIDYKAKGNTVEYMGKEDVEGTSAHKLKMTLKNGQVRYMYVDPDSGLEIKATAVIKREGVENSVDTFFGDYKEVNGLIFPFSVEQRVKDHSTQFMVEKVEVDADLDDSLFQMPAASSQTQSGQ
jgi:outer membrane lipoprotein-sorting protein